MSRVSWLALAALVVLTPFGCGGSPVAPDSEEARILFLKGGDIYVMNDDGAEQRNLTGTAGVKEWRPTWSPDGRLIGYNIAQQYGVYVMTADGSDKRRVATRFTLPLAWSPDGSQILLRGFGSDSDIYVVGVDGADLTKLTSQHGAGSAAWSPDGHTIAFTKDLGERRPTDVYAMNTDGSDQRRLTRGMDASSVSWSHDGRRILFDSGPIWDPRANSEIYVMQADGSKLRNLTRHPAPDHGPVWSPDGRSILFTTYRDENYEIYRMNADGRAIRNLTRQPVRQESPSWSPDGRRIVYVNYFDTMSRTKRGRGKIYVMQADGTGQRNLTPVGARSSHDFPSWSPAG